MKSRTKARSLALQALYEIDLTGHNPGEVLENLLEGVLTRDNAMLQEFSRQIILGVVPIIQDLDNFIAQHAPEWPLDQVAIIDRNIIRIALWEFAVAECTPVKVAINEAIELSKVYGSDSTPRFVNGVLGSLVLRQAELKQAFGAKRAG
ncbi:MAG TPA: transcription antitermination factor NusB [Anaerolineaceae bacterium]